ncbi:MAG: ATP-binding protein [Chloroflexota bacterium]|nr:ATP-binding protein [Chloroflexota bacterium]
MSYGETTLILIGGLPCTGKTTIATYIAQSLSVPWMGKDSYKELLFDTLGCRDRVWSQQLGHASIELLFQFAERQLAAKASCIIESNFRADLDTVRILRLKQQYAFQMVQIHCITDGYVLCERFKRRAESGERHRGHCDHLNYEEFQPRLLTGRVEPLPIEGHLMEVDTTNFAAIPYAPLLQVIREVQTAV